MKPTTPFRQIINFVYPNQINMQFNKTLFLIILIASGSVFQAHSITEESTSIRSVQLFPEHAIVEQSASVNMSSGQSRWVLSNLPPDLDAESITPYIEGADAYIVDHEFYTPDSEQVNNRYDVRRMREEIEEAKKEKKFLQRRLAHIEAEEEMVYANKRIQAGEGIFIEDLEDLATFYRIHLEDILNKQNEFEEKIREQQEIIEDKQVELDEIIQDWKENTGKLDIVVQSESRSPARLGLTYKREDAGWDALYHIHQNIRSDDIRIEKRAFAYQNTGYDWDNVRMTFFTEDEKKEDIEPERWQLSLKDRNNDPITLLPSVFPAFQQSEIQQYSVGRQTLNSGNKRRIFELTQQNAEGEYFYEANVKKNTVPELIFVPDNPAAMPAMEGNMILLDNKEKVREVVAKSPQSFYRVNFGKESRIQILQNWEHIHSRSPFLRRSVEHQYRFNNIVNNDLGDDVQVRLVDDIPYAEDDDISVSVDFEEDTGNPAQTRQNISWILSVPANEEINLPYLLKISHPSDKSIEGF